MGEAGGGGGGDGTGTAQLRGCSDGFSAPLYIPGRYFGDFGFFIGLSGDVCE